MVALWLGCQPYHLSAKLRFEEIMATQTLTGLTTIFTPPSSCSSSWTYEMEFYNSIPGGLLLQNALSVSIDTDCFPSGFAYEGRVPDPIEVYSPGACPAGYATATESFNGDTTLAVCCQRYGWLSDSENNRNVTNVEQWFLLYEHIQSERPIQFDYSALRRLYQHVPSCKR